MKKLVVIFGALIFCAMAYGEEIASQAWTYETGVHLANEAQCQKGENKRGVSVKGTPKKYIVQIRDFFSCDRALKKPWVSLQRERKATLVLDTENSGFFASSCECFKSVTVTISKRLDKGDTLYIVNGHEVIEHVVLP